MVLPSSLNMFKIIKRLVTQQFFRIVANIAFSGKCKWEAFHIQRRQVDDTWFPVSYSRTWSCKRFLCPLCPYVFRASSKTRMLLCLIYVFFVFEKSEIKTKRNLLRRITGNKNRESSNFLISDTKVSPAENVLLVLSFRNRL